MTLQIERYMTLEFMADTPTFVAKLDNEGYLPVSYLTSQKSIKDYGLDESTIIEIIKSINTLSIAPDNTGVRISLPVARKTIILRDIPEDTSESVIRSLLPGFEIECIKKEVANSWFITLDSEESAVRACELIQGQSLFNRPIKARVKSEFYMKVFMKRLQSVMTTPRTETPTRKLSVNAKPFVMPSSSQLPDLMDDSSPSDEIPQLGACWGDPLNIGYVQCHHMIDRYDYYDYHDDEEDVPFVPTQSGPVGYTGVFIRYSPEEILSIVHVRVRYSLYAQNMSDFSLPPIATPGDHSLAVHT